METGDRETGGGERFGKSPDAYRTISEVAVEIGVPQHVLRFWETKFNQIKPLKRGGGRRYYRPEDVALIKGIRHLLYSDGYTIKGVQKVLRENGAQAVIGAAKPSGERLPQSAADVGEGEEDPIKAAGTFEEHEALSEEEEEEEEEEREALRRLILDLRAELVEARALLRRRT